MVTFLVVLVDSSVAFLCFKNLGGDEAIGEPCLSVQVLQVSVSSGFR